MISDSVWLMTTCSETLTWFTLFFVLQCSICSSGLCDRRHYSDEVCFEERRKGSISQLHILDFWPGLCCGKLLLLIDLWLDIKLFNSSAYYSTFDNYISINMGYKRWILRVVPFLRMRGQFHFCAQSSVSASCYRGW